jgi:hypothetical protein
LQVLNLLIEFLVIVHVTLENSLKQITQSCIAPNVYFISDHGADGVLLGDLLKIKSSGGRTYDLAQLVSARFLSFAQCR